MRVRVLTRPTGTIEGLSLDNFRVGGIYELRTDVACVFLSEGWAELVGENGDPVFVRPLPGAALIHPLVLVVDDDPDVRGMTEALLTAHGYDVRIAAHGRDAIARVRERCPDLIVLDLNMPVMDGWQFRTEQRFFTETRLAAVPVLLMTGVDNSANEALKLDAVGVIKKPIDSDDLLEAVSAAVQPRGSGPDGIGSPRAWSRRSRRS